MGFGGMAVDVGYFEYQQRQLQNAADGAAVDGAQQLVYSGCPNSSAAKTAAYNGAASNGFTNGSNGVTVTVSNPPSSGPYSGNSCAVSVQINNPYTPTFFTKLFGFGTGMPETSQAVATLEANDNGCIFLLQPTQTLQFNGTNIDATSCGIIANSQLVQTNGGTIDVGSFGYAQSYQDNATSYPGASPMPMLPAADPCPEIAGCAYLATNPPSPTGCTSFQNNGASEPVQPGCYSLFQLSGGTITMASGLYIFTGVVQDNGATVIGNGVTMYVTSTGGPVQFNGSSDTFSAPTTTTSGGVPGVLLYQVPSNTQVVQFNGGTVNMSGLVYAPNSLGQVNGNGGQYLVLVFGDMQFNGSNTLDLGGPVTGQSLIQKATLVQ
jgi:Putative Flp pilus-assembly TadE/G-like